MQQHSESADECELYELFWCQAESVCHSYITSPGIAFACKRTAVVQEQLCLPCVTGVAPVLLTLQQAC